MAKSPAHRFGQIIGDLLEHTLIRYCQPIAARYHMYLDYKHPRPARNYQNEVRWTDINGNTHKLDIVIEQGGSDLITGDPRAFIEIAWRRYTRHSRNKAQEISAAIRPLVNRYREFSPFYGAVLAGEFTGNSLHQMTSEGFKLMYFPIEVIEAAFASQGVDVHWDEDTPKADLQSRVDRLEALSQTQLCAIGDMLMQSNTMQWNLFQASLQNALERMLESISITSLYGYSQTFRSLIEACDYIAADHTASGMPPDASFDRYEIVIMYSNGDKIEMQFKEPQAALTGLMRFM